MFISYASLEAMSSYFKNTTRQKLGIGPHQTMSSWNAWAGA